MRKSLALVAALSIGLAACSDDDPTGPDNSITAQMRADAAEAIGETAARDVEAMTSTSGSGALFAFGGDFDTSGCTLNIFVFLCNSTAGGLNGEASILFTDAAGDDQDAYDAATTGGVTLELGSDGTINRVGFSSDYDASRDLTLSGMVGAETNRVWNGSGSTSFDGSLHDNSREYSFDVQQDFNAVNVPTGGSSIWPTAGSVDYDIDLTIVGGDNAGETRTGRVDFNGSADVPLTVGGTSYSLDLATGAVVLDD